MLKEGSTNHYKEQLKLNEILLNDLYSFIEKKVDKKLSIKEKEDIKKDFFDYLMDSELEKEYTVLISEYILSITTKEEYLSIINKIKEGILIYEGICFSGNVNETGKWNTRINLYLEQEILFFIVGYNGKVHKEMYGEMLSYIREINTSAQGGNKFINLYYDQEVKQEIDSYFSAAEIMLSNHEAPDPSKKPMVYILEGAKTKSDIAEKKAKFYAELDRKGIKLFRYSYYQEDNYKYSLINQEIIDKAYEESEGKEKDYVAKCCDKINYIEILRRGNNKGFDKVGHLLLTANGVILRNAVSEDFLVKGDVPKATTIDFLMNKFWFELKKGFGKGSIPKTLNIISRAQIALSYLTNDKISSIYEEVKDKYKNGEISDEESVRIVAELRSYSKTPEEIDSDYFDDMSEILEYEVATRIEEMKREEIEKKENQRKIVNLEGTIEELKEKNLLEAEEHKQREEKNKKEFERELEEKEKEKRNIQEELNFIKSKQEAEERKKQKIRKRVKRILVAVITIIIVSALFFGLYKIGNIEESISGPISVGIGIVALAVQIIMYIKKDK